MGSFIAGLIVGLIFGFIIGGLSSTYGTIHIDKTNPEKDRYNLEINDLDGLEKKKKIVLKVDTRK